ncbi:MAG TPA: hypothetical protein VFG28_11995 [Syntrophales bacterium]|nr:hypothetical protein [Syntrophales bacterium]
MMNRKHQSRALLILAAVVIATGLAASQGQSAEIRGQRPMMIVGDTFQFTPGAWASYFIHDREKMEYYKMYIATLERLTCEEKSCSWMEVGVTPEKDAAVVTRFLVEETRSGPGEIFDVVVQVQGYSPFTVPKSFYKGDAADKDVGNFRGAAVAKRITQRIIPIGGRTVNTWDVEAVDAKGGVMNALISEEVAPIGVVLAESPLFGMYLSDWGNGAKSRIEGTPVNFYVWLMMQMGGGLSR